MSFPVIEKRLRDSQVRRFGLCLYNAGMDPHEDGPVGALAGITDEHIPTSPCIRSASRH